MPNPAITTDFDRVPKKVREAGDEAFVEEAVGGGLARAFSRSKSSPGISATITPETEEFPHWELYP